MSFDHSGRIAFITGAGSGIGRATALRLAQGAAVAVVDIRLEAAEETVASIADGGGTGVAFDADVRDRSEIESARDGAVNAFGHVNYLVNNAGLVRMSPLDELSEDEWDLVLDTNLKGMYLVTQAIAPVIAGAGGGAIVNLATIESEVVVASTGHPQVHYNASKGGVKMLTKALAVELADRNIRVNAVEPGAIATSFIPGGNLRSPEAWASMKDRLLVPRVGEPEDVAAAISFLLSDDASYITGAMLPVDGVAHAMTLDLADLEGFGTVVVTSADVTGRPVGKRVSVDVFRRIVHEGIPLSSCVLGWDVDQWPGPVQGTRAITPVGTTSGSCRISGPSGRRRGWSARRSASPTSPRWVRTSLRRSRGRSCGGRSSG